MRCEADDQGECPNCANPPHNGPCRRLHRPPALGEVAVPSPAVANASGEQGAALAGIRASDALAELAGVSPEELARIKKQESR